MFYLSLTLLTFLSGTILPIASEAFFATALALGRAPAWVIFFASLGNCSAVAFNYFMGMKGVMPLLKKFGMGEEKIELFHTRFKKWDWLLFLVSWVPFIGDPITVYAGVIRYRFLPFFLIAASCRIARYIALFYLIDKLGWKFG